MRAVLCRALAVLIPLSASPALAEERMIPEHLAVAPVSEIYIQFVLTNEGPAVRTVHYGAKVRAVLHAGSDRSETLDLVCADPRATEVGFDCSVPAGGFDRVRYRVTLPPGFLGPVVLDVPEHSAEPAMFSVQIGAPARMPAPRPTASEAVASGTPGSTAVDAAATGQAPVGGASSSGIGGEPAATGDREAILRRSSQVLPGVSAYEPVYFGLGAMGGLNAKFQLSLKYNPIGVLPVYAGFTQTSLWDLHGESKPFKDSAYRPSLFFLKDRFWTVGDKTLVTGVQTGFEHESNGKGALDSRSINTLFFRPRMTWIMHRGSGDDRNKILRLIVSPKFYGYIEKSENPDIPQYRGYCDMFMALSYNDWKLSTILRKGTRSNYGSVQVDAVFPMRETEKLFSRFGVHGVNGYWFAQYFNGWGESIIDYRTKQRAQFRLGIMVVP